jgi:hypothetical protein
MDPYPLIHRQAGSGARKSTKMSSSFVTQSFIAAQHVRALAPVHAWKTTVLFERSRHAYTYDKSTGVTTTHSQYADGHGRSRHECAQPRWLC